MTSRDENGLAPEVDKRAEETGGGAGPPHQMLKCNTPFGCNQFASGTASCVRDLEIPTMSDLEPKAIYTEFTAVRFLRCMIF